MKPYYQDDAVTIYHGDCQKILPTIKSESVDMMLTDPPYGHDNHDGDFNARLNEHRGLLSQPIANDSPDTMRAIVDFILTQAVRFLKPECTLSVFCGGGGGHYRHSLGSPREWTRLV